ncbi:hypothetical protein [Bacillus benzoevorans]|uniref:Hook-length control protein FliK n=1 Tax=Bacillus benzoevorans TaxID=1456 RepID=A0A7X0HSL2_9BACI|nr:hypothetical protein [Bacillus benzoevorans]MBB6445142.1 hypothetical protein [Bacillus benzoevorans]
MQIMKGINANSLPQREQSASPLKQGEVCSLLIKTRIGNEEAVAVIKGQEVQVQFEGKMPSGDRLTAVIGAVNEKGLLVVRPTASQPAGITNITDSLKTMMANAGFPFETNRDLLAAAKRAAASGGTVNEEILTNLQYFLAEEPGTISEKLKTIATMLEKKLELSVSQLHAVHQTLHGKNTAETLAQLAQSLGIPIGLETQTALPEKEFQVINQALEGKGDLYSAVEKWFMEFMAEKNDGTPETQIDQTLAAEVVHTQQAVPAKKIIVTEITKRLAGLAADFKKEQRSISLNLEQLAKSTNSKQNRATAKQTLENTIHKLNQVILKSDMMLYADMETEKHLLTASSRLAEAGGLIEKGNLAETKAIVQEIKGLIDKIQFKPANVKIMHFTEDLLKQSLPRQNTLKQTIKTQIEQAVKPPAIKQPSARQIFENIKALGLTHELDAAANLLQPKQEQLSRLNASLKQDPERTVLPLDPQTKHNAMQQSEQELNLKAALIKFLQSESSYTSSGHDAEQTIAHLTGQQLLNKSEATGMQQLYLQLPLLLNNKMENIKVYVSSEKQGETLDWENCSLYFVLETKKMGEIGIMVHVQNRQLSLTFKNDQELFQAKMEPLTGAALERLQEIGYHTGAIQYGAFTNSTMPTGEQPTSAASETRKAPAAVKKGFDFSI